MKSKLLKKLGIGVCVLSMVLSSSVLGNSINQGTPVYVTDKNEIIAPYTDVIKGKNVSTSDSTWTSSSFTIPNSASYFNVDFKNTTSIKVTVKVMDDNGEYKSFTVDPNDQEYLQVNSTGEYYIQIDKEGGNIKGTLRVAYY